MKVTIVVVPYFLGRHSTCRKDSMGGTWTRRWGPRGGRRGWRCRSRRGTCSRWGCFSSWRGWWGRSQVTTPFEGRGSTCGVDFVPYKTTCQVFGWLIKPIDYSASVRTAREIESQTFWWTGVKGWRLWTSSHQGIRIKVHRLNASVKGPLEWRRPRGTIMMVMVV